MRPKLNLKNKGQMSTPNEYTDHFKSNLTCIYLSVRATLPSDTVERCTLKIGCRLLLNVVQEHFIKNFNF